MALRWVVDSDEEVFGSDESDEDVKFEEDEPETCQIWHKDMGTV